MSIEIYSYGFVDKERKNGKIVDICHHEENECKASRVIVCTKNYYLNGKTTRSFYDYLSCYTRYIGRFYEGPYNTSRYCV